MMAEMEYDDSDGGDVGDEDIVPMDVGRGGGQHQRRAPRGGRGQGDDEELANLLSALRVASEKEKGKGGAPPPHIGDDDDIQGDEDDDDLGGDDEDIGMGGRYGFDAEGLEGETYDLGLDKVYSFVENITGTDSRL